MHIPKGILVPADRTSMDCESRFSNMQRHHEVPKDNQIYYRNVDSQHLNISFNMLEKRHRPEFRPGPHLGAHSAPDTL